MRNHAVILQQCNAGSEYIHLIEETFVRHMRYCRFYGYDYRLEYGDVVDTDGGSWAKVKMISDALKQYEYVIWLDADAFVLDTNQPLTAACVGPCNGIVYHNPTIHINVGVLYWRACDESQQMIADWLATMPGENSWYEQYTFNVLMVEKWPKEWVKQLPPAWNYDDFVTPECDHPIVYATHGYTGVQPRLEKFRSAVAEFEAKNRIRIY